MSYDKKKAVENILVKRIRLENFKLVGDSKACTAILCPKIQPTDWLHLASPIL